MQSTPINGIFCLYMEIGPHKKPSRRTVRIDDAMERLTLERHLNDWRDFPAHLRLNAGSPHFPRTISLSISQIGRVAESLVAESEPPSESQLAAAEEGYGAITAVREAMVAASLEQVK
jgi:hypothetical protein